MEKYTTRLGDKICEHTATSSIGLRHICKQLDLPYSTVTSWVYDPRHELCGKYTHAKMMQLHHIEEEILEIADDSTNDYMTIVKNGKKVVVQNRESIARSRLRIQTRVIILTKLAPKRPRYNHEEDKIDIQTSPAAEEINQQIVKKTRIPIRITPSSRTHATPPSRTHVKSPSPSERAGVRPHSSPKKTFKAAPVAAPEKELPYACSVMQPGQQGVVCR